MSASVSCQCDLEIERLLFLVFLTIMLTWTLGTLVSVSELLKSGDLSFETSVGALRANRRQIALGLLVFSFMLSGGAAIYFYTASPPETITGTLGRSALLVWAVLSLTAAAFLFMEREVARFLAVCVGLTGALFALPVMIAGQVWVGLLLGALSLAILYFLWDSAWGKNLLPVGATAFFALSGGLFYAFLQANLIKNSIAPQTSRPFTSTQELRVFEASLSTNFLTLFYIFVIILLLLAAFVLPALCRPRPRLWQYPGAGQSGAAARPGFLWFEPDQRTHHPGGRCV